MRTATMSTMSTHPTVRTSTRVVSIALWVLQVLMAALFFWHGQFCVFPPADTVAMINETIGEELRVFIGVAEMLAAAGLLLPALTRMLPFLISLAAAGLMIVMSSATAFHLSRGETASAISAFVIFVLVTFVAYGRWKVAPIAARHFVQASCDHASSVGHPEAGIESAP